MKNNFDYLWIVAAVWILSMCVNGAWLYIVAFAILCAVTGNKKRKKSGKKQKKYAQVQLLI